MPEKIIVECSGNIVKNVIGVTVPTTGNPRGIDTSAILGSLAGSSARGLEVLTSVTSAHIEGTKKLLLANMCKAELLPGISSLRIIVRSYCGSDNALVEISGGHTNIVRIEKNSVPVFAYGERLDEAQGQKAKHEILTLHNIYKFANEAEIDSIAGVLEKQAGLNTR